MAKKKPEVPKYGTITLQTPFSLVSALSLSISSVEMAVIGNTS